MPPMWFLLSQGICRFPRVPSQLFGHRLQEEALSLRGAVDSLQPSPLCVQLCSPAVLTALSTSFQAWELLCTHFAAQALLQSPGLFPWIKSVCLHAQWPAPAVGCTGKGSASGCTCLPRGSALALRSAGLNACPELQGFSFAFVSSNPFPSGGGMGGVGMP